MSAAIFHLAFNVRDLGAARRFYGDLLGCVEGRSTATWVDFDFVGHQISLHLGEPFATANTGHVGDVLVPMPHFGLALELPDWKAMAARLEAADPNAGTGMELQVIAAVVIGGTSLMGGRGSVVNTAFGVLIIAVLEAGLAQVGASEPSKRIITGIVIVAAVIVDTLRQRRAAKA